jgi:hypothetical protein
MLYQTNNKVVSPIGTYYSQDNYNKHINDSIIKISDYIKDHTKKNDTIMVFPVAGLVYLYSDRLPASRHYDLFPGTVYSKNDELSIIKDIKSKKPKYIMITNDNFKKAYDTSTFGKPGNNPELYKYVLENYSISYNINDKLTGWDIDLYLIK